MRGGGFGMRGGRPGPYERDMGGNFGNFGANFNSFPSGPPMRGFGAPGRGFGRGVGGGPSFSDFNDRGFGKKKEQNSRMFQIFYNRRWRWLWSRRPRWRRLQ